jgi:uncharacterized protein YjgD (DUF1641 family)
MPQDAMQIKERIISLLKMNGPSLPVHIAKGTGQSILFASAFLSELFYEKKISISNTKVGNSPLYFIPGQEAQLERFYTYLNSKEKEAFLLLKDKKFLKDSEQQPAIRIALREIKDFAIPFKNQEEVYWRFFTIPEEEFNKEEEKQVKEEIKEILPEEKTEEKEEELKIFEKEIKKPRKKRVIKKRINQKQDDNFFNKVKEFLSKEDIEIMDIQNFNRNHLILKIKEDREEKLVIAYNKKRVTDTDLIKAYNKSLEENLPYIVLSLGDSAKKLRGLILAIKNLSRIEKIE